MVYEGLLWIGEDQGEKLCIRPEMANRHGLIAGATGTGKTVTLKVMAESFSDLGIPVFLADVKGDLAGMCRPGQDSPQMRARLESLGLKEAGFSYHSYPVCFWDIFGEKGLPLRTTISEMGPTLLARLMGLTDTQTDVLTIVFRIADEEGLLLLDTKDLRAMLLHAAQQNKEYASRYGSLPKQSINSILRNLASLEEQGAEQFFGEPALDIRDWFRQDSQGRGMINILHSESLIHNPKMYSTFMLWMVSELFEILPEAGDCPKPKMVFFFDEAHLLFDSVPKTLLEKIEQVVKLIRSKGVGIYFITQNPRDIPDGVMGQLGNKIQHALHAYTPAEQKGAKAAAQSFRENPDFDTFEVLTQLGIGEALVSVLDEEGIPTIVKRCKILPPQSRMGALDEKVRGWQITDSLLYTRYSQVYDRESAYEILEERVINQQEADRKAAKEAEAEKVRQKEEAAAEKQRLRDAAAAEKARQKEEAAARKAEEREQAAKQKQMKSAVKRVAGSAAGSIGREVGNSIGKSIGGSFGKRIGGNVGASLGRGILSTLFKG